MSRKQEDDYKALKGEIEFAKKEAAQATDDEVKKAKEEEAKAKEDELKQMIEALRKTTVKDESTGKETRRKFERPSERRRRLDERGAKPAIRREQPCEDLAAAATAQKRRAAQ